MFLKKLKILKPEKQSENFSKNSHENLNLEIFYDVLKNIIFSNILSFLRHPPKNASIKTFLMTFGHKYQTFPISGKGILPKKTCSYLFVHLISVI